METKLRLNLIFRRQLAEQQLREEQHLRQALEQQKAENNRFTQEQIDVELSKAKKLGEIDIDIKVKSWQPSLL